MGACLFRCRSREQTSKKKKQESSSSSASRSREQTSKKKKQESSSSSASRSREQTSKKKKQESSSSSAKTDAQLESAMDDLEISETASHLVISQISGADKALFISILERLYHREKKDPHRVIEAVLRELVARKMFRKLIRKPEYISARTYVLNCMKQLFLNQPSRALSYMKPNVHRYATDFKEIRQLGEGGFGSVYEALNNLDGRSYAIKKICIDDVRDSPRKVFNEVKTLAALDNPYIVRYHAAWIEIEKDLSLPSNLISSASSVSTSGNDEYESSDSGYIVFAKDSHIDSSSTVPEASCAPSNGLSSFVQNNSPQNLDKRAKISKIISSSSSSSGEDLIQSIVFIQMELCKKTLTEWLQERNSLLQSSNEIVNDAQNRTIFLGILQGVRCIHSEDVIHRDLKPDNIFLKDGIHVKIGDFGLATSRDQTTCKMNSAGNDCRLHSKGVGTYSYSSPEQQTGNKYDTKTDIYSLGLILYEMYHPFKTVMERNHLFENLRQNRELSPFVLETFPQKANLIMDMTDPDPTKRPTAKEMLAQEQSPSGDEIIRDYEKEISQLTEEIKHLQHLKIDQKSHS